VDIQFSIRYKLAGDEISQGMKMLYYQMILSRNRSSVGFSVKVPQKFDVIRNLSRYGGRPILARSICTNGPAIWGGCVTRRQRRAGSWYPAPAGPVSCHGARRVWRIFCHPGTEFCGLYECRGTELSRFWSFIQVELSLLGAVERSGFIQRHYPVLVVEAKSKKCDKQLTHIVRVMVS
jgi:hypothetical protein